jgi:hypothetical protein
MIGDGVGFIDPISLMILSTIISTVLRYCIERSAAAVQKRVKREPNGPAATRLRGRLREHFRKVTRKGEVLLFQEDEVEKHVDATMGALISATPDEFQTLVQDIHAKVQEDEPVNMSAAAAARDWSTVE